MMNFDDREKSYEKKFALDEELRFKAFAVKKRQLEEAGGVDALVTACANCRNVLEEAIDEYEMDLPVLSLTELLAEYLEPEGGAG